MVRALWLISETYLDFRRLISRDSFLEPIPSHYWSGPIEDKVLVPLSLEHVATREQCSFIRADLRERLEISFQIAYSRATLWVEESCEKDLRHFSEISYLADASINHLNSEISISFRLIQKNFKSKFPHLKSSKPYSPSPSTRALANIS